MTSNDAKHKSTSIESSINTSVYSPTANQSPGNEVEAGKEEKDFSSDQLKHWSTAALKQQIIQLTESRDQEPLSQKVLFLKNSLAPLFEELSQRNPYKKAEEQVKPILGAWSPVWSTIPFQDIIPGRIREQSYQIFHENGYYANIARYAPGHKLPFLQRLASILITYDLMLIQKFDIHNGQWYIKNIGIKQALRFRAVRLSINNAEEWFTKSVNSISKHKSQIIDSTDIPRLENLDKATAKRFEKAFLATPQFEHLYIDSDFRLVKSKREAKQRPSYTVTVRID